MRYPVYGSLVCTHILIKYGYPYNHCVKMGFMLLFVMQHFCIKCAFDTPQGDF